MSPMRPPAVAATDDAWLVPELAIGFKLHEAPAVHLSFRPPERAIVVADAGGHNLARAVENAKFWGWGRGVPLRAIRYHYRDRT
jgi:hypothetical protein